MTSGNALGPNLAPAVHGFRGSARLTWAFVVAEVHRILNKKPRTADADRGVLFRSLARAGPVTEGSVLGLTVRSSPVAQGVCRA